MSKYNHYYSLNVSVPSTDPSGASPQEIIDALKKKVEELTPENIEENVEFFDSDEE